MKDKTCKICGLILPTNRHLSSHIRYIHKLTIKQYYDCYYKQAGEGICRNCKNPTKWAIDYTNKETGSHYKIYCSNKCAGSSDIKEQRRLSTNLKKFGVEQPAQRTDKKLELSKKLKEINSKLDKSIFNERLQKRKKTNIEKFGYSFPVQNEQYFDKCMVNQYKRKIYTLPSGKQIYLQGYEPQFLDYVFTNNLLKEDDIEYAKKRIEYTDSNNGQHVYTPDFYIPKLNLIVEIKSAWTIQTDKNMILKEQACKSTGYNYIRIVNNKFEEFTKLL